MKRGDLVEVHWVDITEDSVGEPKDAKLCVRKSAGYFWGRRSSRGIKCLVTTTTIDPREAEESGWCIYPAACVRDVNVIRRRGEK